MERRGPLEAVTVLDMSQGIAGPSCAGHFAEHGARVIKIEPPEGDWMRALGSRIDGTSAQAIAYNRGKESLALDLKTEEGRGIALKLAARADVLIESARPGVTERLGLGFREVEAVNAGVVYVSVSGWGQRGPRREDPMVDTVGQAVSGLMSVTRGRDGSPVKIDATLIDAITGLYAFQAATMALWGKPRGAGARHLDISLLQASAHIQGPNILEYGYVGRPPGLLNPPAGNYRTADGWMAVTLVNEAHYQAICRAAGRPDLGSDPRFATFAVRRQNVAELRRILDETLALRPTDAWLALFAKEGALAGRINSYGDWLADPHVEAIAAAPPYRLSTGETVPIPHLPGELPFSAPVPKVGADSERLLAEAGATPAEIERYFARGIARKPLS